METTSRVDGQPPAAGQGTASQPSGRRTDVLYRRADFPWYGLDEAYTGPRWLMQAAIAGDGAVEHGSLGHGEEPSVRTEPGADKERFVAVVTVAAHPGRRTADGTGVLEATTVSSAAWLAGAGLLTVTWPGRIDHTLRDDWLDQQTEAAWELADDLGGEDWTSLTLPVDGEATPFHYRESEYGWVLAGTAESGGVHLGAYGRGMSAYGLAFRKVEDLSDYH